MKVKRRVRAWEGSRSTPASEFQTAQYEWEAHVVEYVDFVSSATSVHPNSKSGSVPPNLKSSIPFYGPRFTPPTFLQLEKRKHLPNVKPGTAYMKEITIVHPFYFDGLDQCPR
ncbi:hypothetical protein SERLADRAFT_473153, partial [Serpula lacrymans var. lacrymans S7.9]